MIFELINLIIFFFFHIFFDILQNSQIIKRESVVAIKAEMDTMRHYWSLDLHLLFFQTAFPRHPATLMSQKRF